MLRPRLRFSTPVLVVSLVIVPLVAPGAIAGPRIDRTDYPAGFRHSPITEQVRAHLDSIRGVGEQKGRRPEVIAKVGDSLTVNTGFLACFADGSAYDLGPHGSLAGTIARFAGWDRRSAAAEIGWGADDVIAGNPSPIDREVAAIQPALAVVMLGTNDTFESGVTTFERNLQGVVSRLESHGVVPLLATIPPRADRADAAELVPAMNATIRAVAQHRQVPVVDVGAALAALDGLGLAGDGIHLSATSRPCDVAGPALGAGMNTRNLVTLEAVARYASIVLDRAPADSAPPPPAGAGTAGAPYVLGRTPFVDSGDTRLSTEANLSGYSCSNADESGPEVVYRVEVSATTVLSARVFSDPMADIDVHWLAGAGSGLPSAAQCIARGDHRADATLGPGTYFLVLDTYVAIGQPQPGPYRMIVTGLISVTEAFFAEGTVRPGFVEYLTIQNPGPAGGTVRVGYQAATDLGALVEVPPSKVVFPAFSRVTFNVSAAVAAAGVPLPLNVSLHVLADVPVAVERPVYFSADPGLGVVVDGGTTVAGLAAPRSTFMFAEGTVRAGFVEFLSLQNPYGAATSATVEFSGGAGGPLGVALPPFSRVTVKVNDHVPPGSDVAATVVALAPIVAERVVYFAADPGLGRTVDGATALFGADGPQPTSLFAEGTVRPGFVEYVTLYNPGALAAEATLKIQTGSPLVAPGPVTATVPAGARKTIRINELVTTTADVSVAVTSDRPIVAERPVYFAADPGLGTAVDGGTVVIGAVAATTSGGFAEGTTRPGFVEYVTIQNPGAAEAVVTFSFQGIDPNHAVAVAPASRATVRVNDLAGRPADVSFTYVASAPVVVERVMYFSADPGLGSVVDGGTALASR